MEVGSKGDCDTVLLLWRFWILGIGGFAILAPVASLACIGRIPLVQYCTGTESGRFSKGQKIVTNLARQRRMCVTRAEDQPFPSLSVRCLD